MRAAALLLGITAFCAGGGGMDAGASVPAGWAEWSRTFDAFRATYRPGMGAEEAARLKIAVWTGCGRDPSVARWAVGICARESSMRVRLWDPAAPNRTDYMGAHYRVLFLELERMGLVQEGWTPWSRDPGQLAWKAFLEANPDFGTMLACRRFAELARRRGCRNAVELWNAGHQGTPKGRAYLDGVERVLMR